MLGDVRVDVVLGPAGDRVDLDLRRCASQSTTGVSRPGRGLVAAQAGGPGVVRPSAPAPAARPCAGRSTGRGRGRTASGRSSASCSATVCGGVDGDDVDRRSTPRPRRGCRSSRRSGSRCRGTPRRRRARPGEARWASTASAIEDVTQNRVAEGVGRPARGSPAAGASSRSRPGLRRPASSSSSAARRAARCRRSSRASVASSRRQAVGPAARGTSAEKTRVQARHSQAPCRLLVRAQVLVAAVRAVEGHALALRSCAGPPRRPGRPTAAKRSPSLALVQVAADHPLDVVGQLVGGDLEAAHLAAEAGVQARAPPPRCTWKPSTCSPSASGDQLALEPDVGDLDAGAGVGAAVDVDGDAARRSRAARCSSSSISVGAARLGLDDRELAELDAGAGHRAAPERRRAAPAGRARRSAGDQRLDLVLGDVEDEQLLLGGGPDPVASRAPRRGRRAWSSSACRRPGRRVGATPT